MVRSYKMAKTLAQDYSKYLDHDIDNKLIPVNKVIESMLARLEEFEAMTNFAKQDVDESTEVLSSLIEFNDELHELCSKIDTVEKVVNHIKGNLKNLECEIEKAEQRLKINNDNKLVTNILTPLLFRKAMDTKNVTTETRIFDPKDYFSSSGEDFEDETEIS